MTKKRKTSSSGAKKKGAQHRQLNKKQRNQSKVDGVGDDDEMLVTISRNLFGNADIAAVVFSFMEVRELFNFVLCNKDYVSRLTHKHVVRSALMTGGNSKQSMKYIVEYGMLKKLTIWVPSPVRLLRITCGKKCERCYRRVQDVHFAYGVFMCRKCEPKLSKQASSRKWFPYLDADRVASCENRALSYGGSTHYGGFSSAHFWREPTQDKLGERIGPLVTYQCLQTLMKDKKFPTAEDKVQECLRHCDVEQPAAKENAKEIMDTYYDTLKSSEIRQKEKAKMKEEAKRKFDENKRSKADVLLANILNRLEGDVPWKTRIIDHRNWDSSKHKYTFDHPKINEILEPVCSAPSKVTKTMIVEISEQLLPEVLNAIYIEEKALEFDPK